jgi:hypothetical protein
MDVRAPPLKYAKSHLVITPDVVEYGNGQLPDERLRPKHLKDDPNHAQYPMRRPTAASIIAIANLVESRRRRSHRNGSKMQETMKATLTTTLPAQFTIVRLIAFFEP